MVHTNRRAQPTNLLTLAIDIGGSHLKAGILTPTGSEVGEHVRIETPKPAKTDVVVTALVNLIKPLGRFDRVSMGFPGVVRRGTILTAPNLGTKLWRGFKLGPIMAEQLGRPVRILNDATVQALGVISGHGVECVLTMGTGMGFALFENGQLAPHLEMSQHPIRTGQTYDQYVGEATLEKIGKKHWIRRMHKVIAVLRTVVTYDVLYIGGGNAHLLEPSLPPDVKTVPNEAGITGGVRLWDAHLDAVFAETP
jgi:polyphosphate glucokinase